MLLRHPKASNLHWNRADFRGSDDRFQTVRERAFTLIELLAAIGIISILIGLMFPALHKAHDQAQTTLCMSRLRQIGFAFQNYAAAYDGKIMFSWDNATNGTYTGEVDWFGATSTTGPPGVRASGGFLEPYLGRVRGEDLFDCPVAQEQNMANGPGLQFRGSSGGVAYGGNMLPYMNRAVRLSRVRVPSETLLLADAALVSPDGSIFARSCLLLWPEGQLVETFDQISLTETTPAGLLLPPTIHARHANRANILWFDGHVTSELPTYTGSIVAPQDVYERHQVGQLIKENLQSVDGSYYFFFDKQARTMY
jgi:prepilin-type processing-associated H-X9-DG protein/prepilin-type N-terminal cleavage/methylation domain-containing protein